MRDRLLAERTPEGHWDGELSASALSTATAITALSLAGSPRIDLIDGGLRWLADNQNADGGWGDTTLSVSNISTTMLCRAAFHATGRAAEYRRTLDRCEQWLGERYGRTPSELAEAVRQRYGVDRTFSVPILMMCALAGLVPWREVPRLPFEMACLPQSWYRFARLPVVSYALPALIAIGRVVHEHRRRWGPYLGTIRRWARRPSSRVLERIQPSSGGYLEATPLTSFVAMSLAALRKRGDTDPASERVLERGLQFLVDSVRPDGSWPIDTNLSIWVTTLAVNSLASGEELDALPDRYELRTWLIEQQTKVMHPFTGAAPGAWGWSDHPGSVPDCDDTPGALLAIKNLGHDGPEVAEAVRWMLDLQNRDGGLPTFCRGWGKLPFDRSGTDLTAHGLRAIGVWSPSLTGPIVDRIGRFQRKAWAYLARQQRADGSWLPLWFGNQHAPDDINPVYGTARVLAAYRDLGRIFDPACRRGVEFLRSCQQPDGGWGGAIGCPSSVEETALAVEVLLDLAPDVAKAGVEYLIRRVEKNDFADPSPIGFYFAKLWYFERLYPIIFANAALGKAVRQR